MEISEFQALLKPVTDLVSSMAIDAKLADELNRRFPPGGDVFDAIEKACHEAIAAGWMCANGEAGATESTSILEDPLNWLVVNCL